MTLIVGQISCSFGSPFRALRLNAIKSEGEFFGWSYEDEKALTPNQWNKKYCFPRGRVVFGAQENNQLLGYMAVTEWEGDPTGKTALWSMTYLKPEYRRKGIAKTLYNAREEFTKRHYEKAVFFIKDGNERSAEIHTKNGAEYLRPERMAWNGKNEGLWHWYVKRFNKAALSIAAA